jgi:hypothetical protein
MSISAGSDHSSVDGERWSEMPMRNFVGPSFAVAGILAVQAWLRVSPG